MGSRTALLLGVVLTLAACSDTTTRSTTAVIDSASSLPEVDESRLVVLDGSGNVIVMGPDGSDRVIVTDDAGEELGYIQPIWSPDSDRLAFGQVTPDGFAVRVDDSDGSDPTEVPVGDLPFYMFWSPGAGSIGALHNGSNGLDLEVIDVGAGTASVVDSGSPFYFSWDPAGGRMVTHVGEDRIEVLSDDGSRVDLGDTDAGYLAPQWTSEGIFHVVDGDLVVQDVEGPITTIASVAEFTPFVANRQGTRVALQSLGDDGARSVALTQVAAVPSNRLVVVDIVTGDVEAVDSQPALAFFWSPDGESLLILTPTPDLAGLELKVWSTGGEVVEYGAITPSPIVLRDLIPFFPQYAQSMTFWAPNSLSFALPGVLDGEGGIWVFDVDSTRPRLVSSGVWVSWSG